MVSAIAMPANCVIMKKTDDGEDGMKKNSWTDLYHIFVGLNDAETEAQLHETEKYIAVVDYVCRNNGICYTMHTSRGGYQMENGDFVNENSLDIILMGAQRKIVDELASELCALFGQETVLVLHQKAEMYYLSSRIEENERGNACQTEENAL